MGTYVKNGNSCIGCEYLDCFPNQCCGCNNLKSAVEIINTVGKPDQEKNLHKWKLFRSAGLLWFINRTLHLYGIAISVEIDQETDEVISVYPMDVEYRGFPEKDEDDGYKKLTNYMSENIDKLRETVNK